ncbi:MAG TPA: FHA domain-containing protein [Verrucomicrobiaceae bacterium]|jgi:hypothetical protein
MARIIFTLDDGTEIYTELDSDIIAIGRHPESNVVLPSASVSAHHATIKRRADGYYVQDLGTTNGTKLNGVEVEEAKLEEGDRLSFGDIPALVQIEVPPDHEPQVVELPVPDGLPKSAPKQGGKRPKKFSPKKGVRRGYATKTYQQTSGCAMLIAVMTFLVVAFVGGVCVAHWVKYKRFLLPDLVNSAPVKHFFEIDADSSTDSASHSGGGAKSEGAK